MRIQTPAGFEYDVAMAPGMRIIGAQVDDDVVELTEAVPGDEDLAVAAALVSELADLGLMVLSAEVRGVPMSEQWLDKQHPE